MFAHSYSELSRTCYSELTAHQHIKATQCIKHTEEKQLCTENNKKR